MQEYYFSRSPFPKSLQLFGVHLDISKASDSLIFFGNSNAKPHTLLLELLMAKSLVFTLFLCQNCTMSPEMPLGIEERRRAQN